MLEIRNVGVRYGHHLALESVSVKVEKGEICVILGANGAGKSSLLKAISGMVKVEAGSEIVMNGKTITGMRPHRIVEEGIALVPEGRGIFGDLTVGENLQLGAFARRARNLESATLKRIYELFPRLAERKGQVVRTMSGGEQQMVAIGRALMSKPNILMLDEPSLGLSPLLTKDLFKSLRAIAATGVGILLVEQNAKQSLKIADRGYLIENGLITGENTAAALAEDPAVINAYLGGATEKKPQTASRKIRLPAPFALPSTLEAMGRFMGELASRAGAIQAAFIRFVRREASVPSAFVGRYDAKAGGDPFAEIAAPAHIPAERSRPMVSNDAQTLSTDAGRLAHAAGERLARHVRSQRLSGPRPSAFAHMPEGDAQASETPPAPAAPAS
ncbi:ABC transporter ATP-binding protein, partial [Chelativorans sp. ZYF759]|uniref:ABC transporter ATP-binding protein n=1 Tax=Chelativorans sp. ZYF759 TaxID=2692213 RepID=UPI001AEEEE34